MIDRIPRRIGDARCSLACAQDDRRFYSRDLDPFRQCSEIGDALQFVVRQFDVEMMLQPSEQIERLQAVDAERLEEIVVGSKLLARHFKLRGGKVEDFVKCLFAVRSFIMILVIESGQIRLGVGAFDELLQSGFWTAGRA